MSQRDRASCRQLSGQSRVTNITEGGTVITYDFAWHETHPTQRSLTHTPVRKGRSVRWRLIPNDPHTIDVDAQERQRYEIELPSDPTRHRTRQNARVPIYSYDLDAQSGGDIPSGSATRRTCGARGVRTGFDVEGNLQTVTFGGTEPDAERKTYRVAPTYWNNLELVGGRSNNFNGIGGCVWAAFRAYTGNSAVANGSMRSLRQVAQTGAVYATTVEDYAGSRR